MPRATPALSHALAPLLAALALAGCLGAPAPVAEAGEDPAPRDLVELADVVTLPARVGHHEVNVEMAEGATLAYSFTSTLPIPWDVHSHDETGVRTWAQGRDAAAEGTFTAPSTGVYSLYFRNDDASPADVSFEVRGSFRVLAD